MSMELLERDPGSAGLNRASGKPEVAVSLDFDTFFAELVQEYAEPVAAETESAPVHQKTSHQDSATPARPDFDTFFAELVQEYAEPEVAPVYPASVSPIVRRHQSQEKRTGYGWKAKLLGGVALAGVILLSGLSVSSNNVERDGVGTLAAVEQTADTTSSLPAVVDVPTTTEAPAPEPFLPKPGDIVGVLRNPVTCEETQVIEYSEQEDIDLADGITEIGDATIDFLTPDPTPNTGCAIADERERELVATGKNHIRRIERYRASATTTDNPTGHVAYFQPIAGHATSIKTTDPEKPVYLSVLPGMKGNSVIYAHGSTFSAGFADLALMKERDTVFFDSGDGNTYEYAMVGWEIIEKNNAQKIYDYKHPDNEYAMSLFMCVDEDGNTGKSTHRYVVRLVRVDNLQ